MKCILVREGQAADTVDWLSQYSRQTNRPEIKTRKVKILQALKS